MLSIPTKEERKQAERTIERLEKRQAQRERRDKNLGRKNQDALNEALMTRRRFNRALIGGGIAATAVIGTGIAGTIAHLLSKAEDDKPQSEPSRDIPQAKPGQKLVEIVDKRGLRIGLDLAKAIGPEGKKAIMDAFDTYHSHYGFDGHVNVVKWKGVFKDDGHVIPERVQGRTMNLDPNIFDHKYFRGHRVEGIGCTVLHALTHAQRPEKVTPIDRPFKTKKGLNVIGFHGLAVKAKNKTGEDKFFSLFEEGASEVLAYYANPRYRPPSPKYRRYGQLTFDLLKKTGLGRQEIKRTLIKLVRTNDVWGFVRLVTGIQNPKSADLEKLIKMYHSKKKM
jgi:hypothetical protein